MVMTDAVPTRYWHRLDDGRVQCDVCPRHCRLADGQQGLCFVRARDGDGIVLTTYGRSSGFCIDPIEKKPLNHFLPGSATLSFGTAGCNLNCKFCQNWDISKSREIDTLADAAGPTALAQAARRHGCASVAFTYNDPVIFLEYAVDIAAACHAVGVRTVAVSAGYMCAEPRAEFYRHINAANIDLKAFTERFYRQVTNSQLGPVLETLEYLTRETSVWVEITNLVIPGENDSDQEFDQMTAWVADRLGPDVPMHFTAFHPDYRMLNKPRTPHTTLIRARQIAQSNGLRHVYVGNVQDVGRGSTYCHACGTRVIGRRGYQPISWRLDARGRCLSCGTVCAGVFADGPGDWGPRRQVVRLAEAPVTP